MSVHSETMNIDIHVFTGNWTSRCVYIGNTCIYILYAIYMLHMYMYVYVYLSVYVNYIFHDPQRPRKLVSKSFGKLQDSVFVVVYLTTVLVVAPSLVHQDVAALVLSNMPHSVRSPSFLLPQGQVGYGISAGWRSLRRGFQGLHFL